MCRLLIVLTSLLTAAVAYAGNSGLARFPDIGHGAIVFTAGGDLWSVSDQGGVARRLTTHEGQERFARISPDGKWIAYSAEYEGSTAVWVIPFEGGAARRLTWHAGGGMDDMVWDWTADSQRILFSSRVFSTTRRYQEYYTVSIEGGLPVALPTSDAGPAAYLPNGDLVFNRYMRNFRNWKRYTGGMQQDLWHYSFETGASRRLTDWPGTDTQPMVGGDGSIFFVSDRPEREGHYGARNLFKYVEDAEAVQLTQHADFDVYWPSLDGDSIVYMLGADLRVLTISSGEDRLLEISIPDEALETRPYRYDASWESADYAIGPQGKRVSVVAAGDLYTVPAKDGDWRLVHGGSDDRVTSSMWSPNGRQLAFVSDRSGEQEIWTIDQGGSEVPKQLTKGNDNWITSFGWSPGGTRIFYTDKRMQLWDVDAISGLKTLIDTGVTGPISEASYSADNRWLAYVRPDENRNGAVWIYRMATEEKERVTDDFNNDYAVSWDPKGRYLFFASKRNFDLISNVFEFRFVHRMTDLLFVVRLKDDGEDLLKPLSDEEVDEDGEPVLEDTVEEKRDKKREERRKKKKIVLPPEAVMIDVKGIASRVQRLPIEAGRYSGLTSGEDALFYTAYPAIGGEGEPEVRRFDFEQKEDQRVAYGAMLAQLAAGGEKLLIRRYDGYIAITDVAEDAGLGDLVDLNGLTAWVEPRVEWARTLNEVRRYMRDYFYDPGMHGNDWDAIYERYAALLDRAMDTSDVHWLIGEMLGELNVGHAYSFSGWDGLPRVPTASLGVDLEDTEFGVRFESILVGEPGDPRRTSPLRAPGVDVEEGDYLLAIDGQKIGPGDNPYRWLVGATGRPVRLKVNSVPTDSGAREVTVRPIRSDSPLRYWDWVENNRAYVSEKTDGRVGYVHLPNTATAGYTEFVRGLYAQHDLDGLVIDVRYNGGGFIPEMFIEHLLRPHFNTWVPRDGTDWPTPSVAVHGPKVCIANGYAGSGGDAFPYYFKQFDLGELVGTTTWGGLVGIDNSLSLLIGGGITAPSFAFVNREGEWDVERVGVEPDIEVVEPPEARRLGQDPQLDRAIEQVLLELETWVDPVPPRPERYPVRH